MKTTTNAARELGEKSINKVVTAVRVRPLSNSETERGSPIVVAIDQNLGEVTLIDPIHFECKSPNASVSKDRSVDERHFNYDFSFWSVSKHDKHFADQKFVYESVGKPIVKNCIDGYNSSLFAYGTNIFRFL